MRRSSYTHYNPTNTINPEQWKKAACLHHDPDLFFATDPAGINAAREVCSTCPLTSQCLEAALAVHDTRGIWAGTTAADRAKIRKAQRQAVAA